MFGLLGIWWGGGVFWEGVNVIVICWIDVIILCIYWWVIVVIVLWVCILYVNWKVIVKIDCIWLGLLFDFVLLFKCKLFLFFRVEVRLSVWLRLKLFCRS